jgi:hypothetical protein
MVMAAHHRLGARGPARAPSGRGRRRLRRRATRRGRPAARTPTSQRLSSARCTSARPLSRIPTGPPGPTVAHASPRCRSLPCEVHRGSGGNGAPLVQARGLRGLASARERLEPPLAASL